MGFFEQMNFPRWVILIMLTASAVLAWFVSESSARLDEVELELKQTPSLAQEIQKKALRLDALQSLADKEGMKGETNPELYIRKIAALPNVSIGQVNVNPSRYTPFKGVDDFRYKVDPTSKTDSFSRQKIGNFLYMLEAETRKMRVTSVEIDPANRVRMGEIGGDRWTFEVQLTSRQKADE